MRATQVNAKDIASLDRLLHEPARLSIVACLYVVDRADFVFLQSQTGMTGGNISSHVRKLEQANYITMRKEFQAAKPCTSFALTATGREAFTKYLASIRQLLAVLENGKVT